MKSIETADIPRDAFAFVGAGPAQFAEPTTNNRGLVEYPVTLLARTAGAIEHWYWGRIVHDMAGARLDRQARAIDYCHDDFEILGVTESITADAAAGLVATGKLLALPRAADRAAEVAEKGRAGVPYEASLDWTGPARIEFVDAGATAEANGQQFAGPLYVVREWNIAAIAICPHGADPATAAEFTRTAGRCSVTLFSAKGPPKMPTATPPTTDTPTTDTPPADRAAIAAQFRDDLKRYTAKFGASAAEWLAAGLDWAECLELHCDNLQQQLTEARAQIAGLETRLRQADTGETATTFIDPTATTAKPGTPHHRFAALVRVAD